MENSEAEEIIFQVNNEFITTTMNSQLLERERVSGNFHWNALCSTTPAFFFDAHLVLFLVVLTENDFTLRKIDTHKISN